MAIEVVWRPTQPAESAVSMLDALPFHMAYARLLFEESVLDSEEPIARTAFVWNARLLWMGKASSS